MDKEKIIKCLEKHLRWVNDEEGGEKANLSWANLSGANLRGANLIRANLSGANLIRADLRDSDLGDANLSGANLIRANLSGANLSGANLSGANLSGANLSGANLRGSGLKVFHGGEWIAYITEKIRIGCQHHSIVEWENFTDDEIDQMAGGALDYWRENKEIILMIAGSIKSKGETQ